MTSTLLKSLLSAGRPTFRHFCSASVPAASTGTTANVEASIPTTTPTASDDSALPPAVGDSDSGVEDKIYSKVDIELRAHQPDVLESYNWFATTAAKHLNVNVAASWCDKEPHLLRKTLLKSVHVYSKHRVQYEIRTFYSHINLKNLTGSTALTYLEYIQRNLPEGVAMKVTKHERRSFLKLGK